MLPSADTVQAERAICAKRRQLDACTVGKLHHRAFHLRPPARSAAICAIPEWELVTSATARDTDSEACCVGWGVRGSPAERGLDALRHEFMGGRVEPVALGR